MCQTALTHHISPGVDVHTTVDDGKGLLYAVVKLLLAYLILELIPQGAVHEVSGGQCT